MDIAQKTPDKDKEQWHHVDMAYTCYLDNPSRPKYYLYDKNEYTCEQLKQLYQFQTVVLQAQTQAQVVNGNLRSCLKLPNYSINPFHPMLHTEVRDLT